MSRDRVNVTGDGTKESPLVYHVDDALCDAVERGDWTTGMLEALARWARERLEEIRTADHRLGTLSIGTRHGSSPARMPLGSAVELATVEDVRIDMEPGDLLDQLRSRFKTLQREDVGKLFSEIRRLRKVVGRKDEELHELKRERWAYLVCAGDGDDFEPIALKWEVGQAHLEAQAYEDEQDAPEALTWVGGDPAESAGGRFRQYRIFRLTTDKR